MGVFHLPENLGTFGGNKRVPFNASPFAARRVRFYAPKVPSESFQKENRGVFHSAEISGNSGQNPNGTRHNPKKFPVIFGSPLEVIQKWEFSVRTGNLCSFGTSS